MKQTVTILRGCSGSGKSTWAEAQARPIVSRDRIRMSLFGFESMHNEDLVTAVEDAMLAACLKAGESPIVDDTNTRFRYVKRLAAIAHRSGAAVEVKTFDVPLDEAVRRSKARAAAGGRDVPPAVIKRQYEALRASQGHVLEPLEVKPYEIPYGADTVLVDIDGTLAHNNGHRGFYDWSKVADDTPDMAVVGMVRALADAGLLVVVMSGRSEVCRDDTLCWLDAHDVPYSRLYMRAAGDNRPDTVVKYELFQACLADGFEPFAAVDDRPAVCDVWRNVGLKVFQVGNPYFDF